MRVSFALDAAAWRLRHAAYQRLIVAKGAVAVQFAEIGEQPLDVIQQVRALRMPRQLSDAPGVRVRLDLFANRFQLLMEGMKLPSRLVIAAGNGVKRNAGPP